MILSSLLSISLSQKLEDSQKFILEPTEYYNLRGSLRQRTLKSVLIQNRDPNVRESWDTAKDILSKVKAQDLERHP